MNFIGINCFKIMKNKKVVYIFHEGLYYMKINKVNTHNNWKIYIYKSIKVWVRKNN